MLWFVLAGMTGLAVLCALWPLVFRRKGGPDASSEVDFYKAQLGEIAHDVERGQLPPDEAAAARAESARRLFAASAATPAPESAGDTPMLRRIVAVLVLIVVPFVALALYADLGRPDLPGAPLAGRVTAAQGVEAAIARMESHLAASPDDGRGWAVIGPVYMRLGRFTDAVAAFREALRLNGENAALRSDYGEALVAVAGGVVTADARAAFDQALTEQPGLPAARFYLGLAAEQDGDTPKAIDIYQSLLNETPANAFWFHALQQRLAALKGENAPPAPSTASQASEAPAVANAPQAGAASGPTDDQDKMIRGMVERLATRLAQSGGATAEWQRLIRAYSVLHEPDKAKDALAAARKALAGDAAAGQGLDALASELGIGEGGNAPPAPSTASQASEAPAVANAPQAGAASGATDDSQDKTIRGMVERLATRLAQSGGTAMEWQRLIRAYSVLHEADKAKDALAAARKALASDAAAGPGLDALASELGIGG